MATFSVVIDGTPLHTPGGAFQVSDPQNGPDWGSQAVADVLLTGQYRAEELDQVAAEAGLTRTVTIPLKVDAASADQLVTLQQTLTSTLARASKYAPLTLTVTPNNSTHVSTFKVWGGSWSSRYDNVAHDQNLAFGTLTLLCYWPVYGAVQNLGSSGAPLVSNTVSPAAVTLTPSPAGDIPADVTLFVKNRATLPNVVQTVTISATGGTWSLTYPWFGTNHTISSLAFNIAAATLQSQLNGALTSVYTGTPVSVTGSAGGPYTVTFSGDAALNPVLLTADATGLTGGSHSVTITPAGVATTPIRSMIASAISGNTTWATQKLASTWTPGADGSLSGGLILSLSIDDDTTIWSVASFTAPTLPTDRRFRVYIRADQYLIFGGSAPASFRVRVVTGQAEVIGEWRTPPYLNSAYLQINAMDAGGFYVPLSEVGSLGAGSTTTTVFIETRGNAVASSNNMRFYEALFLPEDSTMIAETSDTGKTLAAGGATVQLESDQVYDSSGNAAAGVVSGPQFRVLGTSKAYVYTSQQYMGTMASFTGFAPENVDVWATLTPRYIGLA